VPSFLLKAPRERRQNIFCTTNAEKTRATNNTTSTMDAGALSDGEYNDLEHSDVDDDSDYECEGCGGVAPDCECSDDDDEDE